MDCSTAKFATAAVSELDGKCKEEKKTVEVLLGTKQEEEAK